MQKSIIFVEGITDAIFLNDLIFHLFPDGTERFSKIKKIEKGKPIKIFNNPVIELFISGGCTHIEGYNKTLLEYTDDGYNTLLIQDADNAIKDPYAGGISRRMEYLESIKTKHLVKFDTFLLPNNKDDGDLENLLLSIAIKDKYDPFHSNYSKYCKEIATFSSSKHSDELLQNKYLIFGYCQVYHGMEMANERNRDYHNNYWNLDHPCLDKLKDFLKLKLGL